jgi:hypothetical protein
MNETQTFNDVWCYDPHTNTWVQLGCTGSIPAPRYRHAAAIVDDVMYMFGGRSQVGAELGDLAGFHIPSRRWFISPKTGPWPSPRSGHSLTSWDKQDFLLGGEPISSSATSEAEDLATVYVLDTTRIGQEGESRWI